MIIDEFFKKFGRKDLIPGGEADQETDESKFDKKELSEGVEEEKEHTNKDNVAKEIAMDHLIEDPKYYSKLKKFEEK